MLTGIIFLYIILSDIMPNLRFFSPALFDLYQFIVLFAAMFLEVRLSEAERKKKG